LAKRLLAQAHDLENVDTLPRHHRDTQAEIDAAVVLLREAAAVLSPIPSNTDEGTKT
jgi:hypothetical protein